MAKRSPTSEETGRPKEGSLTAATVSDAWVFSGRSNLTIWGTFVATLQVERSFDGGGTFHPVAKDSTGAIAEFTAPTSLAFHEPEIDVLYRLSCTAYTSGTINFRFSQ